MWCDRYFLNTLFAYSAATSEVANYVWILLQSYFSDDVYTVSVNNVVRKLCIHMKKRFNKAGLTNEPRIILSWVNSISLKDLFHKFIHYECGLYFSLSVTVRYTIKFNADFDSKTSVFRLQIKNVYFVEYLAKRMTIHLT